MHLIDTVENEINKRKLLKKKETLVLGISGGVDSCVLLDILAKLDQYKIVLAHLNHSLRDTAKRDEECVRALASQYKLDIEVLSCNIHQLSKKRKESLEACGRHARYHFFKDVALKYGAQSIVTAHTADDQIETLVMNYVRGALERGLRGIAWCRQLELDSQFYVARPLLSTWKKDIYEYATLNKIKFHEDETNQDTKFFRNKIRHQVIAKLGAAAKQEMWHAAEKYRTQEYEREHKALKIFKKNVRVHKDKLYIKSEHVLSLDQDIQHRVIEKMCQHVLHSGDFLLLSEKFNSIKKVICSPKAHTMVEIQIGLFLHKQYDEICVADHCLFMEKTFSYRWDFGDDLRIKETENVIRAEIKSIGSPHILADSRQGGDDSQVLLNNFLVSQKLFNNYKNPGDIGILTCAYFDAEKIGKTVVVRNRKDGDKIKPLGMKNYKKVKKILIDSKIPLEIRNRLPIVTSENGNIIWIVGVCVSDDYKIGKTSEKLLKISLNSN